MAELTLEDIARLSGVSRSTVSRVVNNHPNVSDAVRDRVNAVIAETGFHPNLAARSLVSQRSNILGVIIPRSVTTFFTDPYFPRLVQGIAEACNQTNNTLSLFLISTEDDERKLLPRISRRGQIDGAIIQSHHQDNELFSQLQQNGLPFVVAGRPFLYDDVSYIDVDNVNSAHNAVTHLVRLGRKRIATITGPTDRTVGIDRKDGYLKALSERGRMVDENLIVEGDFTEAGGFDAMLRLLPHQPDAVFAASDIMALGAMRAIREAGLCVPEDIAVVGFDDIPMAGVPDQQLTTIRQPVYQMGYQAVELLIDLIENGTTPPRRVILGTELVIRDSSGALRRKDR